jgi:hypothetical protein
VQWVGVTTDEQLVDIDLPQLPTKCSVRPLGPFLYLVKTDGVAEVASRTLAVDDQEVVHPAKLDPRAGQKVDKHLVAILQFYFDVLLRADQLRELDRLVRRQVIRHIFPHSSRCHFSFSNCFSSR